MKINKVTFLYLIFLILIIDLLNYFSVFNNDSILGDAIHYLGMFGRLSALYFLIKYGTLVTNKFYRTLIKFGVIVSVVGAMMKIMHWPFADELLIIGLISTPLVYSIFFLKKETKSGLDFLKLAWVNSAYFTSLFTIMHWGIPFEFRYFPQIIFVLLFFLFIDRY